MLAPMHGVGAPAMRDVIASLGRPGLMCAPFLRVTEQRPNADWIRKQIHRTSGVPLSVQLLGRHPEHLALATSILVDAGVEVVDLNLGCPTQSAMRKGVGAGLLSDVDAIKRVLAAMRAACSVRLSVKIRALDAAFDVGGLAALIQEQGADFLIIHPRTQRQGYAGVADWALVKRAKQRVRIPVVGNGDLWYAEDALRLMRSTSVDAVMLGRPILRNPFLFRQIAELGAGKPAFVPGGIDILDHIRRLAEVAKHAPKPNRRGSEGPLKEQIQFLLRAIADPLRTSISQRTLRATSIDEVLVAVEPIADVPEVDLAANGPLRLEMSPATPEGQIPPLGSGPL